MRLIIALVIIGLVIAIAVTHRKSARKSIDSSILAVDSKCMDESTVITLIPVPALLKMFIRK